VLPLVAQEKRGMKIIVNDNKGIPQELPLYNKTYAVIIGIDRYKNLDYNLQLNNAVSDAKGVQQLLAEKFSFDKFYQLYNTDATKDNILKAFDDLSSVSSEDAIFVFFAGHGYTQTGMSSDVGFIIPSDGSFKENEMRKNISMVELRDNIANTLKAKHIFFVMDACYSGTLLAKRGAEKEEKINYEYLKAITEKPVRQVLTAGGKNEQVLDGGLFGHSVFTGRFLERLQRAENYITAREIGFSVPKEVFSDASDRNHKQNPQFGNLLGEGDFVFIPKTVANVSSEEVLQAELKKLEEENKKLAAQKKQTEEQANKQKQEEVKNQLAALQKKKELEAKEREKQEQERQQQIEEQKRKQELLALVDVEKKKLESVTKEELSLENAIKKVKEYQQKIANVTSDVETQKQKALQLEIDNKPRGEFETQNEYDTRLQNNKAKQQQIETEYNDLGKQNAKLYEEQITSLTHTKYVVGKKDVTVIFGKYDVDNGVFPLSINVKNENIKNKLSPCQELQIHVAREDAKNLREREELLDVKTNVTLNPTLVASIDKITLNDVVHNKSFEMQIVEKQPCNWVLVEGGSFEMGESKNEKHHVTIDAFYISKYEVTQKEWKEIMGEKPIYNKDCDNCPVDLVSWNNVQDYLRKLKAKTGKNYRLPTEAEWEFAARGGNKSRGYEYSGSNNVYDVAWLGNVHPVGTKQPNELGIYDMSGNVGEWCNDWYDNYSTSSQTNPQGPTSGEERVRRGTFSLNNFFYSRVNARDKYSPDSPYGVGFRLVQDK
jgi:formylglycine-generating enzyme required for sulfatase activity